MGPDLFGSAELRQILAEFLTPVRVPVTVIEAAAWVPLAVPLDSIPVRVGRFVPVRVVVPIRVVAVRIVVARFVGKFAIGELVLQNLLKLTWGALRVLLGGEHSVSEVIRVR